MENIDCVGVFTELSGSVRPTYELGHTSTDSSGELEHLFGCLDLTGERRESADGEGDACANVATQPVPGRLGGERGVCGGEVLLKREHTESLQQLPFGAVATVQGSHAYARALGDCRDGRVGAALSKHSTGSIQDKLVVPGCLRLTPSEGSHFLHEQKPIGVVRSDMQCLPEYSAPKGTKMRATVIRRFGAPEVLQVESVPAQPPAPGAVVIDVRYASVTFVETQVRAGRPPNPAMLPQLPFIPGNGVAGTIAEVGDGVDRGLLGRTVVSTTGGSGGYAEQVTVDALLPIAIPDPVPMRDAVALLADGRTALALARTAKIEPGDTVIIEAAAGGVGSCLTQLAAAAGATVIAAVGSDAKQPTATALGAAHVVNYSQPGWDRLVLAEVGPVDVVFDGVGGEIGAAALALLRDGGRFCQFGMASGAFTQTTAARHIEILNGTAVTPAQSRALSVEALRRASGGELAATIGQEYPLEQADAAHAAIEARSTIGKTLLKIADAAGRGGR